MRAALGAPVRFGRLIPGPHSSCTRVAIAATLGVSAAPGHLWMNGHKSPEDGRLVTCVDVGLALESWGSKTGRSAKSSAPHVV